MQDMRFVIAQNIVRLRQSYGMTQAELAEKLNYSDKAISKWERADSLPDVIVLKQLADLFSIRVDDLFCEDAPLPDPRERRARVRNHLIITLLATSLVWLIATFVFVILGLSPSNTAKWLAFIYAIPTGAVVLLVFNSIWGRRRLNYPIISVLVCSLLLCVHLSVFCAYGVHLWLIYLLFIPAEIIILLWSGLRRSHRGTAQSDIKGVHQ